MRGKTGRHGLQGHSIREGVCRPSTESAVYVRVCVCVSVTCVRVHVLFVRSIHTCIYMCTNTGIVSYLSTSNHSIAVTTSSSHIQRFPLQTHTHRQTDKQACGHTDTQTNRQTHTHGQTDTWHTRTHRQTDTRTHYLSLAGLCFVLCQQQQVSEQEHKQFQRRPSSTVQQLQGSFHQQLAILGSQDRLHTQQTEQTLDGGENSTHD